MSSPKISQFIKQKPISNFSIVLKKSKNQKSECNVGDWYPINRFGSGIKEGCKSALYLPCENYIIPKPWSKIAIQVFCVFIQFYALFKNSISLQIVPMMVFFSEKIILAVVWLIIALKFGKILDHSKGIEEGMLLHPNLCFFMVWVLGT